MRRHHLHIDSVGDIVVLIVGFAVLAFVKSLIGKHCPDMDSKTAGLISLVITLGAMGAAAVVCGLLGIET